MIKPLRRTSPWRMIDSEYVEEGQQEEDHAHCHDWYAETDERNKRQRVKRKQR